MWAREGIPGRGVGGASMSKQAAPPIVHGSLGSLALGACGIQRTQLLVGWLGRTPSQVARCARVGHSLPSAIRCCLARVTRSVNQATRSFPAVTGQSLGKVDQSLGLFDPSLLLSSLLAPRPAGRSLGRYLVALRSVAYAPSVSRAPRLRVSVRGVASLLVDLGPHSGVRPNQGAGDGGVAST